MHKSLINNSAFLPVLTVVSEAGVKFVFPSPSLPLGHIIKLECSMAGGPYSLAETGWHDSDAPASSSCPGSHIIGQVGEEG